MENRIIIFSVCDNHYVILLAALLKSIELNHISEEKIDFYIVDDNISGENKEILLSTVTKDIISIQFIAMNLLIPENIKLPQDYSSFPLNIYARLFIPHFIPKDIEKILYMDVDMIVQSDISELWRNQLGEKIIAAVVDRPKIVSNDWGAIANYKELGLPADAKYFNSGLLLINPIKWREDNITVKIIDCVNSNLKFANYPDQYGLNVVFVNDWLELDPLWNCHSTSTEKKPHLIHFSGRKPIYKSYNSNEEYRTEFEKYLSLTNFKYKNHVSEFKRILKKLHNKIEKYVSLHF
jgi:lipopolysaccharide biosynthesis glycosyltransferase